MDTVFLKLVSMSVQASVLIMIVIALRLLLKKSPKWIHCLLWVLVAVRLVCPFSIESPLSLSPSEENVTMNAWSVLYGVQNTSIALSDIPEISDKESGNHDSLAVSSVIRDTSSDMADLSKADMSVQQNTDNLIKSSRIDETRKQTDLLYSITIIWIIGMLLCAAYAFICWQRIRSKVKLSVPEQNNVFICDQINTPFILGILRPRIYLPSTITDEQKDNVLAHEAAHIRRLDHFWKPLGFCLLSIYWFQPVCWIAYILLCRDIELACDEMVIRDMDTGQKQIYSRVLLSFHESERLVSACPLAFGEVGVKQRVKSILNYRKPVFWLMIVAVAAIILTSFFFLTSPKKHTFPLSLRIPAECEEQLVFSDVEFSPQGKKVAFSVNQDIGETEIVLRKIDKGQYSDLMESMSIVPGVPTVALLEKDAWYQVGVYVSNGTAEEKITYITVRNVEVRIASLEETDSSMTSGGLKEDEEAGSEVSGGLMKDEEAGLEVSGNLTENEQAGSASEGKQAENENGEPGGPLNSSGDDSDQEMVPVSSPKLDLSATTGADGSRIYYAEKDRFIFGGYYGLFVYDVTKNEVIRSVDLEPIGCNYTQGENACEIMATQDGTMVLLHPMSEDSMYVYSVNDNQMWKKPFSLDGYELYRDLYPQQYDDRFAPFDLDGTVRMYGLVRDTTIGELGYALDVQSSYHLIFGEFISQNPEAQSEMAPPIPGEDENMGVEYREVPSTGDFVVEGDMVFMYKIVLSGKDPEATHGVQYIVLTNDQQITWDQVNQSYLNEKTEDNYLSGTIIIGVKEID